MKNQLYIFGGLLLFSVSPVWAQNFETSATSSQATDVVSESALQSPQKDSSDATKPVDPFALMSKETVAPDKTEKKDQATGTAKIPEDEETFFVPESEIGKQLDTPTVDGSVRGGQAFVAVDEKGNMKKVSNIFLFYDNFKIHHAFANYTTCDVRFNIISNLDRKLSQFDVKLVWPDMTTSLSFSDISPYTQTYYNYTLLGKGCYSMDKAPNIVVNRCRAKGLTSSECAHKIKWLSK